MKESPYDNPINISIGANIIGTNTSADVLTLYDLVLNTTTPQLAAQDLSSYITTSQDPSLARLDIATQALSIAADMPFAHPQLADLTARLTTLDDDLRQLLSTAIGDLVASESADLKDSSDLARAGSYAYLHAFLARVVSLGLHSGDTRVTGLDDALFIVAEGLETDGASDADVGAAVQYFIHAAATVREACRTKLGRDKAAQSAIWQSKGKLWEGSPGFSNERWEFWKGRMETLQGEKRLDRETRKTAALAIRAMDL